MTENRDEQESGNIRNEHGQWLPGVSGNLEGRTPLSESEKVLKKATKQIIKEYQEALAEALPKIQPVLIAKAAEGDIPAIKELHDRAMGKTPQKLEVETNDGETKDNSAKIKELTEKLNALHGTGSK